MKALVIKNYKNIRELAIDPLFQVNLIVGQNNVGKSTLLEAISIYASDGDMNWLKQILDIRGELVRFRYNDEIDIDREINSFLSFFHNREYNYTDDMKIVIADHSFSQNNNKGVSFRIVRYKEESLDDDNGSLRRRVVIEDINDLETDFKIGFEVVGEQNKALYPLGRRTSFTSLGKKITFEYIQTGVIAREKNAILWDKIALTSKEKYVIEALQVIEPRIDRISFIDENPSRNSGDRIPVVTFNGQEKRYHLSSMGDGINRMLTIILALVSSEGGIFLLDEFENGLHYSVQKQLWKIIFSLADQLNIQVFVTTHSDDCIAGFAAINTKNKGKLIRLENRNDKIVATGYESDADIKFVIEQDIEIR